MSTKTRVGLIYGGKSGEHEVSLQTALAVIKAFDFTKYDIIPFFITKQGEWRRGSQLTEPVSDITELQFEDNRLPEAKTGSLISVFDAFQVTESEPQQKIDVMFPLLHGTFGEDGTIQGLFEMANIPYVGANVLASAVGMDKAMMKTVFAQAGLPQCIYRHFTRRQWEKDQNFFIMEIEIALGYPCFVKPANLGSSVGISKVNDRDELIKAVELAFEYDRKVIVEEFVNAREIELGVLGNDDPEVTVPGEIVSSGDFYDYNAKYIDGKSAMIIPVELPEEKVEELQDMAIKAFQAIDGSGLSRVDFFLRKEDGAILINEVNTMPGFTPFSMYPLLWKASGIEYTELLDRLITLAIERYNERQQLFLRI